MKITEEAAIKLAQTFLSFSVEDENGDVKETFKIQISEILWGAQTTTQWNFEKPKTLELHWFTITIACNQVLLSDFLRQKLNPLLVELKTVKKIPPKAGL